MSKMLVHGSNRHAFAIDAHIGMIVTGYTADGRQIVNYARDESSNYRDTYGHRIVPSILANRLGLIVHEYTLYGSVRPFGSTVIFAGYDDDLKTPELYMIEPSGLTRRYFGCAAGKGAHAANTELEKLLAKNRNVTCREAVAALAKMYVLTHTHRHDDDHDDDADADALY